MVHVLAYQDVRNETTDTQNTLLRVVSTQGEAIHLCGSSLRVNARSPT